MYVCMYVLCVYMCEFLCMCVRMFVVNVCMYVWKRGSALVFACSLSDVFAVVELETTLIDTRRDFAKSPHAN